MAMLYGERRRIWVQSLMSVICAIAAVALGVVNNDVIFFIFATMLAIHSLVGALILTRGG